MHIGEHIRSARKAAKLSQENLARRAGVTMNLVSRLERGEIRDPHYSTLSGIADALGVSVTELLEEEAGPKVQAPPSPENVDEEWRPNLPPGVGTSYERLWMEDPATFHKMAREVFEECARLRRNIEALDVPAEVLKPINENLESLETRARELVDQVA